MDCYYCCNPQDNRLGPVTTASGGKSHNLTVVAEGEAAEPTVQYGSQILCRPSYPRLASRTSLIAANCPFPYDLIRNHFVKFKHFGNYFEGVAAEPVPATQHLVCYI